MIYPDNSHDGIALFYGTGDRTLGGTESGGTQDGTFSWGATGTLWQLSTT